MVNFSTGGLVDGFARSINLCGEIGNFSRASVKEVDGVGGVCGSTWTFDDGRFS